MPFLQFTFSTADSIVSLPAILHISLSISRNQSEKDLIRLSMKGEFRVDTSLHPSAIWRDHRIRYSFSDKNQLDQTEPGHRTSYTTFVYCNEANTSMIIHNCLWIWRPRECSGCHEWNILFHIIINTLNVLCEITLKRMRQGLTDD